MFFYKIFCYLDKRLECIIIDYEKNNYISKIFFALILVVLLAGIYKLNFYTVMIADDYDMSFNWSNGYLLKNMQDVVESTIYYYYHFGGRIISFALGSSFFIMKDNIFFVVNTIGYTILVLVLYINIIGKLKCIPSLLIIIITILFLFMPAFGQVFLWKTGSAMYMWPSIIYFLFLLIYRLQLNKKENIIKYKISYIFVFILGILSSMSNENMSIALIFMISSYIYFYYKNKRIYLWSILGFLGNIIGMLIVLLSPGNYVRMSGHNIELGSNIYYI